MTRVFAILFLNIWHTVPHRLSGSAITILVAVSALTVSGAVFADSSPQTSSPFTTHHSSVLHTTSSPLTPSALPLLHHSSTKHPTSTTNNSNTNNNVVSQNSSQSQTQSTNIPNPTSSTTNGSDTAGGNNTPPNQSATLQLAQVQTTCSQGQTTYTIANATLSTATALDANSTVTYSWDVKYDSGTQPTTPPISNTPSTQTIPSSSSSITLSASDQTQPLLTTSSGSYVYEFRLVVTGPVNATSAWVSVPESTTSC